MPESTYENLCLFHKASLERCQYAAQISYKGNFMVTLLYSFIILPLVQKKGGGGNGLKVPVPLNMTNLL
uniref:Uncharacterized protein n=1 Tax=Lepeophtheirus salmonis TaxID=72036 RepID=A0A0K2V335_LEPSM